MRLGDFTDWLALRKHFVHPWDFLRLRKRPPAGPFVDLPLRDGAALRLRADSPDRHIVQNVFARDEYRLNRETDLGTVIDVGAHIGTFALRASKAARRVIAFEPVADSFALLERNTAHCPNVERHAKAVAGRRGRLTLFLGKNSSAHSLHPAAGAPRTDERVVEALTLADVFEAHGVDRCGYLKLDCEGAEYEILEAASDDLLRRVDRLGMEYHTVADGPPSWTGERIEERLRSCGMRVDRRPSKNRPGKGLLFGRRLS